jgi:hypothetical protein
MEISGQLYARIALSPGINPVVPIQYEADWDLRESGYEEKREISTSDGTLTKILWSSNLQA